MIRRERWKEREGGKERKREINSLKMVVKNIFR